jgi:hypothetical protein
VHVTKKWAWWRLRAVVVVWRLVRDEFTKADGQTPLITGSDPLAEGCVSLIKRSRFHFGIFMDIGLNIRQ